MYRKKTQANKSFMEAFKNTLNRAQRPNKKSKNKKRTTRAPPCFSMTESSGSLGTVQVVAVISAVNSTSCPTQSRSIWWHKTLQIQFVLLFCLASPNTHVG